MPIDPNIALGVRPVQFPNPIESYGQVLNIQNAQGRQQLQQRQIQEADLQLQEQQRAQQEQVALQRAYQQAAGDLPKTIELAAQTGQVRPQTLVKLQQEHTDYSKKLADLDKVKFENLATKTAAIRDVISQAAAQDNPEAQQAVYNSGAARLVNGGIVKPEEVQPYAGPDKLKQDLAVVTTHAQALADAENLRKQKKAEEETAAAVRAAEAAPTELALKKAETEQKQRVLAGTSPSGITAEQQARLDEEKKQHGITNTHEEARIRLEANRNAREERIFNETYGPGANEALRGVEPKLRTQASSAAQKAATQFQTAQRASDAIESMLSLVRSGNKAAGSNLPIVGAETLQALNGIKRINRTEIEQYQGAGSLLDKISGKIGKLVAGQPIPADVLSDIEQMHKVLRSDSEKQYKEAIDATNQIYRSSFKPAIPERKQDSQQPKATHRFNPATGKIEEIK